MLLFFAGESYACKCEIPPPFEEHISSISDDAIIIRGRVVSHAVFNTSMKVEVLDLLEGREERAKVKVVSFLRPNCTMEVDRIQGGSEWILLLKKDEHSLFPWSNNYYISICGNTRLEVIDGKVVKGYIRKSNDDDYYDQEEPLDKFLGRFGK